MQRARAEIDQKKTTIIMSRKSIKNFIEEMVSMAEFNNTVYATFLRTGVHKRLSKV